MNTTVYCKHNYLPLLFQITCTSTPTSSSNNYIYTTSNDNDMQEKGGLVVKPLVHTYESKREKCVGNSKQRF